MGRRLLASERLQKHLRKPPALFVRNALRLGTVELGLPANRVGTHSLRVSCATWLYQAGYDLE